MSILYQTGCVLSFLRVICIQCDILISKVKSFKKYLAYLNEYYVESGNISSEFIVLRAVVKVKIPEEIIQLGSSDFSKISVNLSGYDQV